MSGTPANLATPFGSTRIISACERKKNSRGESASEEEAGEKKTEETLQQKRFKHCLREPHGREKKKKQSRARKEEMFAQRRTLNKKRKEREIHGKQDEVARSCAHVATQFLLQEGGGRG